MPARLRRSCNDGIQKTAARHLNPLSIVVANRLLSRSVIRKIERPFDELLAGAR